MEVVTPSSKLNSKGPCLQVDIVEGEREKEKVLLLLSLT